MNISFVTDEYSRKIVGYHFADNLEAIETIQALRMAIDDNQVSVENLLRYSDRGIQFCSPSVAQLAEHLLVCVGINRLRRLRAPVWHRQVRQTIKSPARGKQA